MSGYLDKVEDPRSLWDKFRRRELYAIAKAEKIVFSPGAPATTMRVMLKDQGVDPYKYQTQARALGDGHADRINIPKDKLPQVEVKTESEIIPLEMKVEDVYLEDMKWGELLKWCKDHGITKGPKDTKAVMLEKARVRLNGKNAA